MVLSNDRIFYACQAITIDGNVLKGVQSIGIDRETNGESLLDVGYSQRKFQRWDRQQFTITISRVVSVGEPTFYTSGSYSNYGDNHPLSIIGTDGVAGLKEYDVKIFYTPDDQSYAGQTTDAQVTTYQNCILTNISYSFNVSGALSEDITLVCRTKTENTEDASAALNYPHTSNTTIKRQDFILSDCIFPDDVDNYLEVGNVIDGITVFGLQSIEISMDISYRELTNVGDWAGSSDSGATQNKWRVAELPLGVSCTFTGVLRQQDTTSYPAVSDEYYANDQTIRLVAENSASKFQWNLGERNYLTNVSVSGGDTGGGNVELSLSYQNDYSDFFVIDDSTLRSFSSTERF